MMHREDVFLIYTIAATVMVTIVLLNYLGCFSEVSFVGSVD